MPLRKLRMLDGSSAAVTLPKGDLRLEGMVDETGDIQEEHLEVVRVDEGTWEVRRVDQDG